METSAIGPLVKQFIEVIGEDPNREGLVGTPERIMRATKELFSGYEREEELHKILTSFEAEGYDQIVMMKNIKFYSFCEHHLLPFFGTAHIGYIPGKRVIGASKLPRICDIFARRMQLQERLTDQIANAIETHLEPKGVMVVMKGIHLCMRARGIEQENTEMITSALRGVFSTKSEAKDEFFKLLGV